MSVSVNSLQDFYQSPLGCHVQNDIARALKPYHDLFHQKQMIGFGYATPYLQPFLNKTSHCFAFMPAQQGAYPWPDQNNTATALICESKLPLACASIDLILMVHLLEYSENAAETMHELWRILSPGGFIITIVTNRQSLWAYSEHTPFSRGTPYSRTQLLSLFMQTGFQCAPIKAALNFLPHKRQHQTIMSSLYEKTTKKIFPYFGGVLILQAQKQLHRLLPIAEQKSRAVIVPTFKAKPVTQKL